MQWHGSGGLATVRPLFLCGWWKYKLNYRQLCAVPPQEANPLLAKCHELVRAKSPSLEKGENLI